MKKTYMIPSQKVVELELSDILLEGSNGMDQLNEKEGYNLTGYEGGYTKEDKSTLWDNLW